MTISKKWRNYIKFLISETGGRVDELSKVVGFNIRERLNEIEPKHAKYVTEMLKQENIWLDSHPGNLWGTSFLSMIKFQIETPYGTTMQASSEELLKWAKKRFADKPQQLKRVEGFLADENTLSIKVSGYKIKVSIWLMETSLLINLLRQVKVIKE